MAKKRRKIGIVFDYDDSWIGGTYYITNLVNSLSLLEDEKKPDILVLASNLSSYEYVSCVTEYPYLSFVKIKANRFVSLLNRVSTRLGLGRIFYPRIIKTLDVVFPSVQFGRGSNVVHWIPDFQDKCLPMFFSENQLKYRERIYRNIAFNKRRVVFSSENALADFTKFYPKNNALTFVSKFAVTHPSYSDLDSDKIRAQYNLPRDYFFCPNQLWKHKNHLAVLNALVELKEKKLIGGITVVFSGKESDSRNPEYPLMIKEFVETHHLSSNVIFLGFIDRKDQLKIMSEAIAVVQPSLFEGWSTVIEDAKAMNKYVIASDLQVNIEQLQPGNASFFNPNNSSELSELLKKFSDNKPRIEVMIDYRENILEFANSFMKIVDTMGI